LYQFAKRGYKNMLLDAAIAESVRLAEKLVLKARCAQVLLAAL
jgi:hypothetical protein